MLKTFQENKAKKWEKMHFGGKKCSNFVAENKGKKKK